MALMPVLSDALRAVAIIVLAPLAATMFIVGWKLLHIYFTDRSEYVRNRERSRTFWEVLRGSAPSYYDGIRDERVSAGVAIDTQKNIWVEQGKLSDEALSNILR